MKTTTNTRKTNAPTTVAEEKAMALMLHLGNDYFEIEGFLYAGTEEEARAEHEKHILNGKFDPDYSFKDYCDEHINAIDASLDAIEAEGYKVCTESDQEPCKNVIDTQVINNTTYYICMRENRTNNADDENTTPSEIEKAIKLLQANDYFVHNKKEDEDVMIVLNVDGNKFPKLFLEELKRLELYTYFDTHKSMEEHLFDMEHLWTEWNEGAFDLETDEKECLERIEAEMREKGCGYFRVIV